MDELEDVYQSSKNLMEQIIASHQNATDFLCALRFLLKANPENTLFINGIGDLIEHQENLRRVATSYHQAVGKAIKDSKAVILVDEH